MRYFDFQPKRSFLVRAILPLSFAKLFSKRAAAALPAAGALICALACAPAFAQQCHDQPANPLAALGVGVSDANRPVDKPQHGYKPSVGASALVAAPASASNGNAKLAKTAKPDALHNNSKPLAALSGNGVMAMEQSCGASSVMR